MWFTISVIAGADVILVIGASVPAYILDIFFFSCPTDSTLLNSSSFSLVFVLLVSDSISCMFCSSDFSWYFDCSSLM